MALRIHDPMMRGMDLIALSIVLKSIEVGIVCSGISGAPSDSGTTCRPDAARHDLAQPFGARLGAFARLGDFAAFWAPDPAARRAPGTLPIRGSPAAISSQARSAASSKSGASAGRTCQPVTFLPNT